jgi:hypothetical protein
MAAVLKSVVWILAKNGRQYLLQSIGKLEDDHRLLVVICLDSHKRKDILSGNNYH